jgi:hypothetical protein
MPTCDSGILEQRMQVCLQAKMPAKAVSKAVSALSAGRGHGDGMSSVIPHQGVYTGVCPARRVDQISCHLVYAVRLSRRHKLLMFLL